jgi:hypothetical protein
MAGEPLASLIDQLTSLDPEDRLRSLMQLKRYAGTRQVDQAVHELRNDGDRRVRSLAREYLQEAEKRQAEALALPGAQNKGASELLQELLKLGDSDDPTQRVTAIKQLRMMDNPEAVAQVRKMRKDSNRVVRMIAESAVEDRETGSSRTSGKRVVDGILVNEPDPGLEAAPKEGRDLWIEIVPMAGLGYLALGVPLGLVTLWLWADAQGLLGAAPKPDAAIGAMAERILGLTLDPFKLAVGFAICLWMGLCGAGLLQRRQWGRRAMMSLHSLLALLGLLHPAMFGKLFLGVVNVTIVYFLSRPGVNKAFEAEGAGAPPVRSTDYGNTERKTW